MAVMRILVTLLALCGLAMPAIVTAHLPTGRPFHISGSVYCDTCRAGFETRATTYLHGATVRLECKDRDTLGLRYSMQAKTNKLGMYSFTVEDDHEDQICTCMLVDSPSEHCNEPDPGRCQASVVATRGNGVHNDYHIVNNMGFLINKPYDDCEELLKEYFPPDEEE